MLNRGLGTVLASLISEPSAPKLMTLDWLLPKAVKSHPNATRLTVANCMNVLARKGMVKHGPTRGSYTMAGVKSEQDPAAVIDNLLAVMAAAEPVLHRCKRLLTALNGTE
jgi:hypothetical protein